MIDQQRPTRAKGAYCLVKRFLAKHWVVRQRAFDSKVGAGAVAVGAGVTTALAGAAGSGSNLAQISSNSPSDSGISIEFSSRNLQHEFANHASDFGVNGRWNNSNRNAFQQAITNHINGSNTQAFQGTYRNNITGTHYYDPNTNLWAFIDDDGNYVAGWKLSTEQQFKFVGCAR